MIEEYRKILKQYNIKQREIAEKMHVIREHVQKYLSEERNLTPKISQRIYEALIEIAKDREIQAVKLQMHLQQLHKLMMDMSNSDSIRDV